MDLRPFGSYQGVYVEITKSEHKRGGAGWGLGACLWSPTRNKAGSDRYALMRTPESGDLVLHFYEDTWPDGLTETRLSGRSLVAERAKETSIEPPLAGRWSGMAPYYRIPLQDYEPFDRPVALNVIVRDYADEILADLRDNEPTYYPFNAHGQGLRTVQGIYLARCTTGLYSLLCEALAISSGSEGAPSSENEGHEQFSEARRLMRERFFFARNQRLARMAKQRLGTDCQVCGFSFATTYGELGVSYAEVHHVSPLSERPISAMTDTLSTTIDQVAVLCANCHRMVHRRRPALTIEELRAVVHGQRAAASTD